jgi:hypothetical protein
MKSAEHFRNRPSIGRAFCRAKTPPLRWKRSENFKTDWIGRAWQGISHLNNAGEKKQF